MRASSSPMPNEAPVIRAVLRSGTGIQHSALSIQHLVIRQKIKAAPQIRLKIKNLKSPDQRGLNLVNRVPRGRGLQFVVDVVNVLHALGFQPLAERDGALLGVDRNTVFPGGASAEDAVELYARLSCQFERLAEFRVADPGREINKWLGCDVGSLMKQIDGFFLCVRRLACKRFRALAETHVSRD